MTVKDIYVLGASLVGDHDGDDQDEELFAIQYLNILMQESLECENSMRERDGQAVLAAAPIVTSTTDEVPYHEQLLRAAFPFGLAWQYHQEAGNLSLASQYRNTYIDAVNRYYCYRMRRSRC